MNPQAFVHHSHKISACALFDVRPADTFDGLREEGVCLGLAWFTDAPLTFDGRKSHQLLTGVLSRMDRERTAHHTPAI